MFPRVVLLELQDDSLRGQVLNGSTPGPVDIEAPLPALTCRDGMPLETQPLGDLIGDLLVHTNNVDAYLLAALPAAAVQWRVVEWPLSEMPDDPVEALRQLDPLLRLPFGLEDAYIDLQPIPGPPPLQSLLVATPRALVHAWIEVFNLAGARLERLAPAQTCQLAALQPLLDKSLPGQLIVLLDPVPEACRLVLLRGGLPVFEHLLPEDPDDLVDELQRCLRFYRRRDPHATSLRLLLTAPLLDQELIEEAVGVKAKLLEVEPFGSLVLQGLAQRETSP